MGIKILAARLRAPTEMDDHIQKVRLDEMAIKAFKRDKKLRTLYEELLSLGGAHVIFPREKDPHLQDILEHGKLFTKRGRLPKEEQRMCEDSQCHWNTLSIQQKYPDKYRVATGYYLQGDDGLWRSHSWLMGKKDKLIYETTVPAVGYFGVILSNAETKKFRDMYK